MDFDQLSGKEMSLNLEFVCATIIASIATDRIVNDYSMVGLSCFRCGSNDNLAERLGHKTLSRQILLIGVGYGN